MIEVLIPAHNEELTIEKTLISLFNQTLIPDLVIVICDNCTDGTVVKVNNVKKTYNEKIIIYETVDNKGKKSGALNQVFFNFNLEGYILVMDADTVIDPKAIEVAINTLSANKNIGAVCSRAGILQCDKKFIWNKYLWSLQHLEYGMFDSHRLETKGKIKVAHGMATMFRAEALMSVVSYRKETQNIDRMLYLEDNLVEDYELTLCLKHEWKVTVCFDMLAWTDVPVSIKELWRQRLRWLRGGVDCLKLHGWNNITMPEILNHFLFVLIMVLQVIVTSISIKYLIMYGFKGFSFITATVILIGYIDNIYRLKYVQKKTLVDYIIRLTFISEILYGWFQAVIMIYSYILSFFRIKQRW